MFPGCALYILDIMRIGVDIYYVMTLVAAFFALPAVLAFFDAGRWLVIASEIIVFIAVFRFVKDIVADRTILLMRSNTDIILIFEGAVFRFCQILTADRTILLMSFRAVNILICGGMLTGGIYYVKVLIPADRTRPPGFAGKAVGIHVIIGWGAVHVVVDSYLAVSEFYRNSIPGEIYGVTRGITEMS